MKKTLLINDPIVGPIDVTSVLPVIDHPFFQRLRFIRQLGASHLIFPSATHTRLAHSLGAYKRTCDRTKSWLDSKIISRQEARDVEIFALLHDIGHGPLSHLIEPLCSRNHNENGLAIMDKLSSVVTRAGGNFENIRAMFSHENPLYMAVADKNLGTEKFDYLERDAYFTAYGQRPGVNNLTVFVSFHGNCLAIDPRAIDEAIQLQTFYLQMYKNVYLRKSTTVVQRMLQRMIGGLMASGLREDRLWEMTDDDLMVEFRRSRKKWIRDYDRHFLSRALPKAAISIKQRRFIEREIPRAKKSTATFGVDGETMKVLMEAYKDPYVIERAELKLAEMAGLPFWSILLIPVTDPHRFVPQDIKVATRDGLDSLREIMPDHFRALEEMAQSYSTVRIATFPEFRERIANNKLSRALYQFVVDDAARIVKESQE